MFGGADPGGGGWGPGGQDSPPPFWGTPKLHKEGKNVARMGANEPHFSSSADPPPFQNPVSTPGLPCNWVQHIIGHNLLNQWLSEM